MNPDTALPGNPGNPGNSGNSGEPSDPELLAAHVDGDADAFGTLFRRHRDRLWAVALRTTGNAEDAADALQDAMVSAFRRADSFQGNAAVTTWLHRIVVNACLDRLRRQKVRLAAPLPDDLDDHADLVRDSAPDVVEEVAATDLRTRLLRALEDLPSEQRAALVLVDMQGYSVEEAAAVLECPTGTVKSRCARGRRRLAELLGSRRQFEEGNAAEPERPEGTGSEPGTSHPGGRLATGGESGA